MRHELARETRGRERASSSSLFLRQSLACWQLVLFRESLYEWRVKWSLVNNRAKHTSDERNNRSATVRPPGANKQHLATRRRDGELVLKERAARPPALRRRSFAREAERRGWFSRPRSPPLGRARLRATRPTAHSTADGRRNRLLAPPVPNRDSESLVSERTCGNADNRSLLYCGA